MITTKEAIVNISIIKNLKNEISDLRSKLNNKNISPDDDSTLPSLYSLAKYQIEIHNHFKMEAEKRK